MTEPHLKAIALALALAVLSAVRPAAAQDAGLPESAYAEVNAALVENHVLPRYRQLSSATAELDRAAGEFCAGDANGLDALRGRYNAAMDAWMGIQHVRFGPVELFMRAYRLYFWPEARSRIGGAVRDLVEQGAAADLGPDDFRATSVSVAAQGLPAVEYLLYGDDALLASEASRPAACRVLTAVTANMKTMAAQIVADWQGGDIAFTRTVTEPGPKNPYFATHQDATLEFFKSLHSELQLVADVKLLPVIGDSADTAKPNVVESALSARALRNIVQNLEAVQALYLGEGGPGLSKLVQAHGDDEKLDPLMRKAFRMTLENARSIDPPLAEAVTDPAARPKLGKLQTQVLALKQIVKTRLATALKLMVGFNALDGD